MTTTDVVDEEPAQVPVVFEMARCAECRREIFTDTETDHWLHWDPHFDCGPFSHEATPEKGYEWQAN